MRTKRYFFMVITLLVLSGLVTSGCAVNFYKQSPRSKKKIKDLQDKISDLERKRMEERARFEAVKGMLEKKLRDQIGRDQVSLRIDNKGLVIMLSDEILFDPGKAELKAQAYPVLDKVVRIIRKEVPDKNIGIEGHTDNVPIKYSGWKSNWELSTARATNVLHYMEDKGVPPKRLSATGYGEHRPVASNSTVTGQTKNRRVEIVILPEFVEKKKGKTGSSVK